eukprot:TRINITY_DN30595_c0_g1_i1.p1 TRINITY_DN30595_c0_g1~~TRINITY_DN30595_c0_g1_i1.p1  ORF type:complete len:119 (-),score=5.77 TRINITY_DN30595_c0_g1_i1:21-377(-)
MTDTAVDSFRPCLVVVRSWCGLSRPVVFAGLCAACSDSHTGMSDGMPPGLRDAAASLHEYRISSSYIGGLVQRGVTATAATRPSLGLVSTASLMRSSPTRLLSRDAPMVAGLEGSGFL